MKTIIAVPNNDILRALRTFLVTLLESGAVDAIYTPLETGGAEIVPALVVEPDLLNLANPIAPVMPINGARAVSAITNKKTPARLAAVLRPCEIRALVELVKLKQATFENLVLIGLDCVGTFEVNTYKQWQDQGKRAEAAVLEAMYSGEIARHLEPSTRAACQMCIHPHAEDVDIVISLFGANSDQGIPVELPDEIAERIGGLEEMTWNGEARSSTIDSLIGKRKSYREKELGGIRSLLTEDGGMVSLFASCIRCHNCMTVCPICYCKTCLFRSPSFDHSPEYYLNAARRKGAVRLMSDTMLFHATRLNHMSLSCVSCGMCTSACPVEIPVGSIFSAIGDQVQAKFGYTPGKDVNEPLPLVTFQPEEWTSVGESS